MEAIASRLEAIVSRWEPIASRLEAIVSRLEAIVSRLEAKLLARHRLAQAGENHNTLAQRAACLSASIRLFNSAGPVKNVSAD